MRIAYLDCPTGISGDMTAAALLDAGVPFEAFRAAVESLGLHGVSIEEQFVMRGAFRARRFTVHHPEQHAHRGLAEIRPLIARAALSARQRSTALAMFQVIAEAEAKVHGSTPEEIHFHEVGAIDSIVDIVCAAVGFDVLGVDEVVCSPLPPGRGFVRIAHGECPLPAPGTAELLKGMPLVDVPIQAELTTPTGAAIVRVFANRFSTGLPSMRVDAVGYGAGGRDLTERANVLRLFVGEVAVDADAFDDTVAVLQTNLDDVTSEVIGHVLRRSLEAGALDAFATPIQMKKFRPACELTLLVVPEQADHFETLLFRETGTLGIRRSLVSRVKQQRIPFDVETDFGRVAGKLAWRRGVHPTFSPEYNDCTRLAEERGVPLRTVQRAAETAFDDLPGAEILAAIRTSHRQHSPGAAAPDCDDHRHDHDHDHRHDHDHDHRHDHDHDHRHDHDHDHRHDHDHGRGRRPPPPPQ